MLLTEHTGVTNPNNILAHMHFLLARLNGMWLLLMLLVTPVEKARCVKQINNARTFSQLLKLTQISDTKQSLAKKKKRGHIVNPLRYTSSGIDHNPC